MKKILALIFISLLVACSNNNETVNNDNEADNDGTNTEEEETNDGATEDNTENDVSGASDDEAANEEEEALETGGLVSGDAQEIMMRSSEAMRGLTSYLVEGESYDETTIGGTTEQEESELSMKMVLANEATTMHMNMTSSLEDSNTEMYMLEDTIYMYDPSEELWYSMDKNSDSGAIYGMFTNMGTDDMDNYAEYSDSFEVTDNGDHYLLSFTGNNEDYQAAFLQDVSDIVNNNMTDDTEQLEMSGTYEIMIDKETFYMIGYTMDYEIAYPETFGGMAVHSKGNYTFSNFDEYDEITVPDEVVNEAVSMGF